MVFLIFKKTTLKPRVLFGLYVKTSSYSSNHAQQNKIFLKDTYSEFTYKQLDTLSKQLSQNLLSNLNTNDLEGSKIGVYCSNNYTYLISLLAIWRSNGTPLCLSKLYPLNYLEYFLNDSKCQLIINSFDSEASLKTDIAVKLDSTLKDKGVLNYLLNEQRFFQKTNDNEEISREQINLDKFDRNKNALLIYTSGTSGPPKGVVITFNNLLSSMQIMRDAWKWTDNDCMLSTLPLNHYSGLVYTLLTPFYVGAQVDLMPKFNASVVWSKLLDEENSVNMFIGVPTVFSQLIDHYSKNKDANNPKSVSNILNKKMRIIGSGSAPLNVKTYNDWFSLTNYRLLERYGMTEIGMALTNPYVETSETKRIGGTVGRPCGSIKVRIVDEINNQVQVVSEQDKDMFFDKARADRNDIYGELQVAGPIVFKEYYNKKEQTENSFTDDGWFRTGDTAQFLPDSKIYKIIGRTTVDVIKSGGYKISALDIEKELLAHPQIEDVAIMGMPDQVWGQRVFALIVLKGDDDVLNEEEFKKWCGERLPKYSIPTVIKTISKMPRNMMGKVNKKDLIGKIDTL